jgi:gliding motility associated protien GldN
MKISKSIFILFFIGLNNSFAQDNLLNAKSPQEIGVSTMNQRNNDNDNPLPYGYIDDRDVLWSKVVWERIDLDERVNFPLYFPVEKNMGNNRKSLFEVLYENIKNGTIQEIYEDEYFEVPYSMGEIENKLLYIDTTEAAKTVYKNTGVWEDRLIDRYNVASKDIEEWLVKGVWYIDKRQGEMRYRVLAISPVATLPISRSEEFTASRNEPIVEALFWIWYPELREILHQAKAFNRKNTSKPISFDQIFNSRRFSATIYREDNVMADRSVADYINDNALMQLLESDRIKDQIRNIEIDLWNY